MTHRPLLAETARTSHVADKAAAFHADVVAKVQAAVSSDAVVVVGMAQNPFVKKARQALTEAGVPFTYLEFGSYLKAWKERLAIKMWSGWPTFPQVYVRGTLIGGNDEAARRSPTVRSSRCSAERCSPFRSRRGRARRGCARG